MGRLCPTAEMVLSSNREAERPVSTTTRFYSVSLPSVHTGAVSFIASYPHLVNVCVCVFRRHCRRCMSCLNRPVAACCPCWTDGRTGASPGREAGASPSRCSTTGPPGQRSSPSELSHTNMHTQTHTLTHMLSWLTDCHSADTLCPTSPSSSRREEVTAGGNFLWRNCCQLTW